MTFRLKLIGSRLQRHGHYLVLAVCTLLVFSLAFLSPVSYMGADSLFNLVVSQAILERGTIQLDSYAARIVPELDRPAYELVERVGHVYSIYPLGTPVFSLPFVWLSSLFGRDMSIIDHNYRLQNDLSALLCTLTFLVLYWTGRHYLSPGASLLIALTSVLGSALVSTTGTALWTVDWAGFFLALSLWLLVRYQTGLAGKWDAYLLGSALFAAYFCRPAVATYVLVALIYLWVTWRREGVKAGLTALAWLLPFVAFTWLESGQFLPDYYYSTPLGWLQGRDLGQRVLDALLTVAILAFVYIWLARPRHRPKLVAGAVALLLLFVGVNWIRSGSPMPDLRGRQLGFGMALYALLLSPSRGLLVFSPFLVPVLLGSLLFWKALAKPNLATVVWSFFGLHLLGLVSTGAWRGGYSYGPRLLADVLPALALLTVLVWKAASTRAAARWRRIGASSYVVLGIVAVLINSYQGLWNINTLRWNGEMAPMIDVHPEYVFDWAYPQFLATSRSLCDRNREHMLSRLASGAISVVPYRLRDWITYGSGEDDTHDTRRVATPVTAGATGPAIRHGEQLYLLPLVSRHSKNAVFVGWLRREAAYRRSVCRSPLIVFELDGVEATERELVLEIVSGAPGVQEVSVFLNGVHVGDVVFPGPLTPAVTRVVRFDRSLLRWGDLNEIEFYIPNASSPEKGDDRTYGLAFAALRLRLLE